MKVYLKKDVEKVGMAGEIIKVSDGYAHNFLFPRGFAVEITTENESYFNQREKKIANRKEVIAHETSMVAEKISNIKVTIKQKMHDDGKLFGAINPKSIVQALEQQGINVSKSQIIMDKPIKTKGTFDITIKLTSRLMPKIKLTVLPE